MTTGAQAPRDPDLGLFGPGSVAWKVNREAVLLLGGGRALLMQIAHPLVAAGVADHSDFKQDPFGRLRRTLDAMLTITFGSVDDAQRAYEGVNAVHGKVRGTLAREAAMLPAGTPYRARDPELLLWVHATLVDTALSVYERYVQPLSPPARERYYQESHTTARLFRIPERLLPPDLEAFDAYVKRMIEDGPIAVSDTGRDLSTSILHPPIPFVPSALFEILNLVTAGLLPARLREGFGLRWTPARQVLLDASSLAVRALLPLLPDLVRAMPHARAADRRASAA